MAIFISGLRGTNADHAAEFKALAGRAKELHKQFLAAQNIRPKTLARMLAVDFLETAAQARQEARWLAEDYWVRSESTALALTARGVILYLTKERAI